MVKQVNREVWLYRRERAGRTEVKVTQVLESLGTREAGVENGIERTEGPGRRVECRV